MRADRPISSLCQWEKARRLARCAAGRLVVAGSLLACGALDAVPARAQGEGVPAPVGAPSTEPEGEPDSAASAAADEPAPAEPDTTEYQESPAQTDEAPAPSPAAPTPAVTSSSALEATGLDARVRRLSDQLALAIKRLPGDHRFEPSSVMPFAEVGEETRARQLGAVVSDLVLVNLSRDHRMALTERSQLDQVLQEQALAELGVTDPQKAAEVGGIAGARAVVVGEIADVGGSFKVTARVVDTTTAQVVGAVEADLPKEELIALSADAVVLKSKAGAFFRSLVAPGWGQVYNQEPVKAGFVGGGVAALAGTTLVAGALGLSSFLLYSGGHPDTNDFYPWLFLDFSGQKSTREVREQRLNALYLTANAGLWTAIGLGGVTAVAWGLGAVEAYASGIDVDSIDDALLRE